MSSPTRKIILLSGDKSDSHDIASKVICENFSFSMHLKLSEPLKNAVHALYGKNCSYNAYDRVKEFPHQDFMGLAPNQAYTEMSAWIKSHYGLDFCANILCRIIQNFGSKRLFVISELEHPDEAQPLINLVGQENVLHLKLYPDNVEEIDKLGLDVHLPNIRTHKVAYPDNRQHLLKSRIHEYVNYWMQDRDGFKGQSRVA